MGLRFKKHQIAYALTAGLIAITPTIQAANSTLNFNTLPSAQGWVYVAMSSGTTPSNVPESSVFSVNNGILTQNTLGQGALEAIYQYTADFSQPFTLKFTARLLATDNGDNAGFAFSANEVSKYLSVNIHIGSVSDYASGTSVSLDTSLFHNYEIDADPAGVAGGSYKLYIDGNLAFSSSWANGNTTQAKDQNKISFGDATPTGSNAKAEISSLSFFQPTAQSSAVSVPLPVAAEWLLGLALVGLIGFNRRKPMKY